MKRTALNDAMVELVADSWMVVPIIEGMGYYAMNTKKVGQFAAIPGRHELGDVFERIPRPEQRPGRSEVGAGGRPGVAPMLLPWRDDRLMSRFIARRLLQGLVLICLVATVVFFLGRLTGNPVDLMLPEDATPEDRAAMIKTLGLDGPLHSQFLIFV